MWGRKRRAAERTEAEDAGPGTLKEAVRQARLESAERIGVVVDLRDAELARLELLNEALNPVFGEIPPEVELFDRGLSRGDTPRLWIDAVAHVAMGRDKRRYRLLLDTRFGRRLIAESNEIDEIVKAVTHYVASRMIERERALAADESPLAERLRTDVRAARGERRWRMVRAFIFGLLMGCVTVFATLWYIAYRLDY